MPFTPLRFERSRFQPRLLWAMLPLLVASLVVICGCRTAISTNSINDTDHALDRLMQIDDSSSNDDGTPILPADRVEFPTSVSNLAESRTDLLSSTDRKHEPTALAAGQKHEKSTPAPSAVGSGISSPEKSQEFLPQQLASATAEDDETPSNHMAEESSKIQLASAVELVTVESGAPTVASAAWATPQPPQPSQPNNRNISTAENNHSLSIRSLSLAEVLEQAIDNSEFITDRSTFLSPNNGLLNNPQFQQSVFDLELQKSSQQGVTAALADFDAQLTSGFQWGRNSVLQSQSNVINSDVLISENGTFYGRLDKPLRTGGTASLVHNLNYSDQPQNNLAFAAQYQGYVRGEFRQPMLAGRGKTFTDISGPTSYRNRRQGQGLALAEIAEKTAELDYHLGLQRLLKQTEDLYWEYWYAEQVFQHQQAAVDNAEAIWSRIRNRANTGLTGGGAADDAQAEENFYRRRARADNAELEMQQAAARLKNAIGERGDDQVHIVATNSPQETPIVFEVDDSVANALNNRSELFKQDLQIQAIEYQLLAAQGLKKPQLDLVTGVQFNGLGDQLFDSQNGAYSNLTDTDDVGWNVGFEFSMPLGMNRERTNVRYLRLLLNKARRARELQEREIENEISYTAKSVRKWSQSLGLAARRLSAAQRRLAAVEADFLANRASLDLLLRSQDAVADAQTEFALAQSELTKSQNEFLFRQGRVLTSDFSDHGI